MSSGLTFELDQALAWGTLPQLNQLASQTDRARYLRSYTHTYLKEEILVEQLVRIQEALDRLFFF